MATLSEPAMISVRKTRVCHGRRTDASLKFYAFPDPETVHPCASQSHVLISLGSQRRRIDRPRSAIDRNQTTAGTDWPGPALMLRHPGSAPLPRGFSVYPPRPHRGVFPIPISDLCPPPFASWKEPPRVRGGSTPRSEKRNFPHPPWRPPPRRSHRLAVALAKAG